SSTMSSLSAITWSLSFAFMRSSERRAGALDAFRLDRGDGAGLERNLPGAADAGPPCLLIAAPGLADEAQGLVGALHAGDRQHGIRAELAHDKRVEHDIASRHVALLRGGLLAGQDEEGAVLAPVFVHINRRGDEAPAQILPSLDVEFVVIGLADEALGEDEVRGVLLDCGLWRLLLGGSWRGREREQGEDRGGKGKTGKRRTGDDHGRSLHGGNRGGAHSVITIMTK